jgi:hypothetical protein
VTGNAITPYRLIPLGGTLVSLLATPERNAFAG